MVLNQTCVVTVLLHAQKIRVHECVKRHPANLPLSAAETLHLFGVQLQSGHFQILSAEPFDCVVNCSHGDCSPALRDWFCACGDDPGSVPYDGGTKWLWSLRLSRFRVSGGGRQESVTK
jgi:hypothetical protein